jgi:hypothetical protein
MAKPAIPHSQPGFSDQWTDSKSRQYRILMYSGEGTALAGRGATGLK